MYFISYVTIFYIFHVHIESSVPSQSDVPPELPMDPCDEDEFDTTLPVSNNLNEDVDNSAVYYESSNDEYDSGIIAELLFI